MGDEVNQRANQLEADAVSLLKAGDSNAAQQAVEQAIRLVESNQGEKSPRLVSLLRLLAKLLAEPVGKHGDRAAVHLVRALDIAQAHGADELVIASICGQVGAALQGAGRLTDARKMYERALELSVHSGRTDEISFDLLGLATVVTDIDPKEAVPLWERLVNLEASEQAGSLAHMMALGQLGECLIAARRGADAIPPLEHALSILETRTKGTAPHRWAADYQALLEKARSLGE